MARKLLVTGGAGFIGSHLVDSLACDPNNKIIVFDNMKRGRLENLAAHEDNPDVTIINGDIRDAEAVMAAARGVDTIYHLAAQSNVMGAVSGIEYSFETNVRGTFNVLQAAHENKVRRVVFTSSREVYGEAQYTPVDEMHPINSKNTYGASKAAGELYCQVFHNNFGVDTVVLRLANVYGPRDFGRVIPLWIDRATRGMPLTVFGGAQEIDFVWVSQVVTALERAATANIVGTPVNIGSGQATPILKLAERILSLVETESTLDRQPARHVEVVRFEADIERMRQLLGMEPPDDPLHYLVRLLPAGVTVNKE